MSRISEQYRTLLGPNYAGCCERLGSVQWPDGSIRMTHAHVDQDGVPLSLHAVDAAAYRYATGPDTPNLHGWGRVTEFGVRDNRLVFRSLELADVRPFHIVSRNPHDMVCCWINKVYTPEWGVLTMRHHPRWESRFASYMSALTTEINAVLGAIPMHAIRDFHQVCRRTDAIAVDRAAHCVTEYMRTGDLMAAAEAGDTSHVRSAGLTHEVACVLDMRASIVSTQANKYGLGIGLVVGFSTLVNGHGTPLRLFPQVPKITEVWDDRFDAR